MTPSAFIAKLREELGLEPVSMREDTSVTMTPNYKNVVGLKFRDLDALTKLWDAAHAVGNYKGYHEDLDDLPTPTIWRDGDGYKAFWTGMVWEEGEK